MSRRDVIGYKGTMSKISLNDVTNINSVSTINENFTKIEQELQNKVLYRDNPVDEPNEVKSDIDFNGFDLLNVGVVHTASGETWASSAEIFAIRDAVELDRIEVAANKDTVIAARDTTITNANNVASLYDQFDDRYLGAKASDPTLDNDGNTLVTGALYFNTSDPKQMKVYNGSAWQAVATFNTTTTTSIDGSLYANQTEAEQGINNTKVLTPLRTAQAIAANTSVVHRTGDETIAGIKTFSSPPVGIYGSYLGPRFFTNYDSPSTYTPTAGTRFIIVEILGGGGASGGLGSGGSGAVQISQGGGHGGYAKVLIRTNFSGATITVGGFALGPYEAPWYVSGEAGKNSSFVLGGRSIVAYGGAAGMPSTSFTSFPATLATATPGYTSVTGWASSDYDILELGEPHSTNYTKHVAHSSTFVQLSSGLTPFSGESVSSYVMTPGNTSYFSTIMRHFYFEKIKGDGSFKRRGSGGQAVATCGVFNGYYGGTDGSPGVVIIHEYS